MTPHVANSVRNRIDGLRTTLREDGLLRTVLKNAGWLTGSSGLVVLFATIQGILTARMLGVAVWGLVALASSFCGVIGKLLSFRMNDFVVKWVTQLNEEDSDKAATVFRLALVADVATSLTAFLLAEVLATWGAATFAHDVTMVWLFRWLAITVALQAGRESFQGMLQVTRTFRSLSAVRAGVQIASTAAMVVVFFAGWGLTGVVVVLVSVDVVTNLLIWIIGLRAANGLLPRGWLMSRMAKLGDLRRDMAGFAVLTNIGATFKIVLDQGDILLLGIFRSPAEVAFYKLAKSITTVVYVPMMPIVDASYPEFSLAAAQARWPDFRRLMRRGSKVSAAWFVPATIGAALIAPVVISATYGPSFVPAVPVLAVLLIGVAVDGIMFWSGSALLSLGQPGYLTRVGVATAALRLVLALLLVPQGGVIAMAAAAVVSIVFMNGLSALRIYKSIPAADA